MELLLRFEGKEGWADGGWMDGLVGGADEEGFECVDGDGRALHCWWC